MLTQGALAILYEMDLLLREITGMAGFTMQPLAGAHGELTGMMIMAAYHRDKGNKKSIVLAPDSAHGTNPASAAIAGYRVVSDPEHRQRRDGYGRPQAGAERRGGGHHAHDAQHARPVQLRRSRRSAT